MPTAPLHPLTTAGVIGMGLVLGWLAGVLTRTGPSVTRLAGLGLAVFAAGAAALAPLVLIDRWDWSPAVMLTSTAAVAAVVGSMTHQCWIRSLRAIATRAGSAGDAHADARR